MSELPKGWVKCNIDSLCTKPEQFKPSDTLKFKYIDISSVDRESKTITSPSEILGCDAPSRARKLVNTGDIIVSMTRPNLNAVAKIPPELDGNIASTGFDVLKPILIEPDWLFSIVKSKSFIAAVSGTTIGALYPACKASDIRNYELPLPPLAEQKRIVAKLGEVLAQVDTIKARLDRIPAILKRFRQSVLAAAVSGKLTEEWRGANSFGEYIKLGELLKDGPQNGLYKPSRFYGKGTKIFRIDSFYDGELVDWETIKRVELEEQEVNKYRVNINDVLVNRVNSIEYLGKCALVRELPENAVFESNIMRMTIDTEKALPAFVTTFLRSIVGLKELRKNAKLAVNQASINQTDVKSCLLQLPTIKEQKEIVRLVDHYFVFADTIEAQVKKAQARVDNLTQSILAKAFRGELVAQDPNDEPADKLLERIAQARIEAEALAKTSKKVGGKGKATS